MGANFFKIPHSLTRIVCYNIIVKRERPSETEGSTP